MMTTNSAELNWHNPKMAMPKEGEIVECLIQHCTTKSIEQQALRCVSESDCNWRFPSCGSELSYDWSVIAWRSGRTAAQGEQSKEQHACHNCMGFGWEPSIYDGRRPCGFCKPQQAGSAEQSKFPISDEEFQRIFDSSMTRHAEGVLDVRAFQRKLLAALSAPERKVTDEEIEQIARRLEKENLHYTLIDFARAVLKQQGEQTAPEWISVKDRLPEIGKEVRFKTHSGNELIGWLTVDDDWWVPELNTWIGGDGKLVAHWMPLPAAPTTAQTLPLGKTDAE